MSVDRQPASQEGIVDLSGFPMKRQPFFGLLMADALESPHEVQMPGRAAELAVGDDMITGRLLFCHQFGDAVILNCFELEKAILPV